MIAYTGYAGDARVRREAETLVLNGYAVSFLVPKAGDRPRRSRGAECSTVLWKESEAILSVVFCIFGS